MDKIKITNQRQFEQLVEELQKNPSLARGFQKGTVPNNLNEQWESIATVLNSLGPPLRSGAGWQKVGYIVCLKTMLSDGIISTDFDVCSVHTPNYTWKSCFFKEMQLSLIFFSISHIELYPLWTNFPLHDVHSLGQNPRNYWL